MGIKGIYKEIGQGKRVSLCKLATEHLEQTQRPFRLAIDISIWQFQVQAARGGSNPAIRTLFYRLARLLGNAVEPIFVFDGPNKPAFKRNKRSGRGDGVAAAMAKRLIRLFGFTTHDAPGEAEAECALLQQQGIVDAVLSEDVDTIMFGCGRTLRNWSAEGTRGSKTPTHVTIYDAAEVAAGASGLDREGMILVALMSGGDYIPEGVSGCGIKVACEAARAGFGRDLCRIKRSDKDALAAWKERLLRELHTNESRFFRTKHRALDIPENFPNVETLRYYTHPVVSRHESLDRLKRDLKVIKEVDIDGLRKFVEETFDWTHRVGAIKFIRVIAPSLLVQRLVRRCGSQETLHDDLDLKQLEESVLVKAITSRRTHFSTDATPELRVSFLPIDIVKIDLGAESEEQVEGYARDGLALNSDGEFEDTGEDQEERRKGVKKPFDPLQYNLAWIPQSIVKMGVPLTASDWDDKQRARVMKATAKPKRTTRAKKPDMPSGALDKYVKVTKKTSGLKLPSSEPLLDSPLSSPTPGSSATLPPSSSVSEAPLPLLPASSDTSNMLAPARGRSRQAKKTSVPKTWASKPTADVNPWTIASSQASPRAARSTNSVTGRDLKPNSAQQPIVIDSSPAGPTSTPPPAALTAIEQTTPTRKPKRLQSPPTDDPVISEQGSGGSPSVSTVSATKEQRGNDSALGRGSPEPRRQARPFKRTKSGAEEEVKTSKSSQTSIKIFGRIGKASSEASSVAKEAPIEIPSDDEASAGDETFLPLLTGQHGEIPKQATERETSVADCHLRGGGSRDGDDCSADPLVSETRPSSRVQSLASADSRTSLPSRDTTKPLLDSTSSSTHRAVLDDGRDDDDDFDLPPLKSTATTAAATTTKLFIPRTRGAVAGYVREIEVPREEADDHAARLGARLGRRVWRRSEIPVVDLTGDD